MSKELNPATPTEELRPGHFQDLVGEVFLAHYGAAEPLSLVLKEVTLLKPASAELRAHPFSLLFESEHHLLATAQVILQHDQFGPSESLLMTLVGEGDSQLFYEIVIG